MLRGVSEGCVQPSHTRTIDGSARSGAVSGRRGGRTTPMAILHLKAFQTQDHHHHRKERNMRKCIVEGTSHSMSIRNLWMTGIEVSPVHAAE